MTTRIVEHGDRYKIQFWHEKMGWVGGVIFSTKRQCEVWLKWLDDPSYERSTES